MDGKANLDTIPGLIEFLRVVGGGFWSRLDACPEELGKVIHPAKILRGKDRHVNQSANGEINYFSVISSVSAVRVLCAARVHMNQSSYFCLFRFIPGRRSRGIC
jgi:hypothetical protein